MREKPIKTLKKSCVTALAFLMIMSASACRLPFGSDAGDSPEGYEIWGAPTTEKVLQNEAVSKYEAIKTDAKISVDTAKNEYEAAQVIISAGGAVDEYTVEVSDLKLVGGDETYAKENISVYNLKYVYVDTNWNDEGRVGWYPDALLPFDAAVKAGENTVEEGKNQSVYFSFNTPQTQTAGTYTGKITLTVDGEKNEIPVSLRVRNVEVNATNHVKSNFRTSMFYRGEYDATQAMLDTYNKFLLEYRICGAHVMVESTKNEEAVKLYVDKAYEIFATEKASTLPLVLDLGKGKGGIPEGQLVMYLTALMEKSLETGYDLLSKCYVMGIDEPASASGNFQDVVDFSNTWDKQKNETIQNLTAAKDEYLAKYPDVTSEYYEQLLNSLSKVAHVTTVHMLQDYVPYVDIFCPSIQPFENGLATDAYAEEDRVWMYSATGPKSPYPNTHIDRNTTLPIQMLGWLMSLYDVEGYLYWGASYHEGGDHDSGFIEDYYSEAYRANAAPGDGFLTYPGAKYGIDGPIPSIRIEAMRDSFEDYELFYNIKQTYNGASANTGLEFSAKDTISSIMERLHATMSLTATSESFMEARTTLLDLAEFTQSGVCFTSTADNGEGVIEYELYVPDGVEVSATGVEQIGTELATGGRVVSYRADMNVNTASKATFKATYGDVSHEMSYKLPGKVTVFAAETLQNGITSGVVTEETILVNASDIIAGADGKLLKLSLPAAEGDTVRSRMEYADNTIFSKFNANAEKAVFKFYYTGTEETTVYIYVKYANRRYEEAISSAAFVLKPGENIFEWSGLSSLSWEKSGSVQLLAFEIGDWGAAARSDVYMKNIVIYEKEGA